MKKYDVVALGELLIDFTSNGVSEQGNNLFEANPGGAPCNLLAMLQKLEKKTAFIGKVGKDSFGKLLAEVVKDVGIDVDNLVMDEQVPTTLAFVHTAADGDRSFSFYRNPGADMMLNKGEVNEKLLKDTKIFHFGTLSMTASGVEEATKFAIDTAKENGVLISFDPNLRPPLWSNLEDAKEKISYGLGKCDILKISDDEIEFMTGETDIDKGISKLKEQYDITLICATMGKNGSKVFYEPQTGGDCIEVECKPFLRDNTIETTGAGDTFGGCMLHAILENGIDNMGEKELYDMLEFANAAASLITTKKGALKVMPSKEEVFASMKEFNR